MPHLSEGTQGRQVGSGGDGERWGSDRGSRASLNEQIALVLIRLQEDMQNVLQRLHKLETLTASQVSCRVRLSHWYFLFFDSVKQCGISVDDTCINTRCVCGWGL